MMAGKARKVIGCKKDEVDLRLFQSLTFDSQSIMDQPMVDKRKPSTFIFDIYFKEIVRKNYEMH